MLRNFWACWIGVFIVAATAYGQEAGLKASLLDDSAREIRSRYEQILERNPFQEKAFDQVYEGYLLGEGVDAWLTRLTPPEGTPPTRPQLIVQGRIFSRQLKTEDAIEALEGARALQSDDLELDVFLGQRYYEAGRDEAAIGVLSGAVDQVNDPELRGRLCRILGSVYLRAGKREEAIATWKRLVDTTPDDIFAQTELAEIYEDNRMWAQAIEVYQTIVSLSEDDPYRRCRSLRAIGMAHLALEAYDDALAVLEMALELAAPGNWLFADLQNKLVSVYEDRGDLAGLTTYLQARIEQHPGDLTFHALLARTELRQDRKEEGEAVLKALLERAPDRLDAVEMLLELYQEQERFDDRIALQEKLVTDYPAEPDYLRRLGNTYLEKGDAEMARTTWRRLVADEGDSDAWALLADWLETEEFYPEALEAYEAAIALRPDRNWLLRRAGLRYDMGDEAGALADWVATTAPPETSAGDLAEIAAILKSHDFPAESKALLVRAVAQAPEQYEHALALARVYVGEEKTEEALPLFQTLAEQDDNEYFKSQGEQGLLDAYITLGTIDEMRAGWERDIVTSPQDVGPRLKLARLCARSGDHPGAVQHYEACVKIEPEVPSHRRNLAEAYIKNRQIPAAIAAYEELLDVDKTRAAGYLRDLLKLYNSSNQRDAAIATAEKLVETSPTSAELRIELAKIYMQHKEHFDEGIQQYRNAIQLRDDEPSYYRDFGDALLQAERVGEAQEIYRTMLEVAQDARTRIDAIGRLAGVYVRLEKGDIITEEFQERVRANPGNLALYEELATVFRARGERAEVMKTFESARDAVDDTEGALRLVLSEAFDTGDYPKVVEVYTALLEINGAPTVYELSRLAEAHARVGDMDGANETWQRISKENKDDADAQLIVARGMGQYGFVEEAQEYIEKALAIDPYNYQMRFSYAQQLASIGSPDEALEQLQLILEIGEKPVEDPTQANPTTSTSPVVGQFNITGWNPGFSQGGFRHGGFGRHGFGNPYGMAGFYPGRVVSGSQGFTEFRPMVLSSMVSIAQQLNTLDELVAEFHEATVADPNNIDARYDYLQICESGGKFDEALETLAALRAIHPDDTALLWRIFQIHRSNNKPDEAIAMAREIIAREDTDQAYRARLQLLPLLVQNNHMDEAETLITALTESKPDEAQTYVQIAHALRGTATIERVAGLFQKAIALEPTRARNYRQNLAQLYKDQGDMETARDMYFETILAEPKLSQTFMAPGRTNAALQFVPPMNRRQFSSNNNFGNFPGFSGQLVQYDTTNAFQQILQMTLEESEIEPLMEKLLERARTYATAEDDVSRYQAWESLVLAVAYRQMKDRSQEALELVESILGEKPDDPALQELQLFALYAVKDYIKMKAIYGARAIISGAGQSTIDQALLNLAVLEDDWKAVVALYPATRSSQNPYQLAVIVSELRRAKQEEIAIPLLEDEVRHARSSGNLLQLAQLYSNQEEHDKAIDLAREVWQRSTSATTTSQRRRGGNYTAQSPSLSSMGLNELNQVWNIYRQGNREDELLTELEEKVAKQPTSVSLRLALAGAYGQDKRAEKALEQLKILVEQRPNDMGTKLRYAGALEAANMKNSSVAILEELVDSRRVNRRELANELQRLYRELGRTEKLADLQDTLMVEAQTSQDLQQLAQTFAQSSDFIRAAEMMEKAFQKEPENVWLNRQRADYLWQANKRDEALEIYKTIMLPSGTMRQYGMMDGGSISQFIRRFSELERLDELKALTEGDFDSDTQQYAASLLKGLIAKEEGDFEAAEAALLVCAKLNNQGDAYRLLTDNAVAQEDYDKAVTYAEKEGQLRGRIDFRRIADIYTKKGDIEKAVPMWKRHVEQQGQSHAHREAIDSMITAKAFDMAEAYLRDVLDALPDNDWAKRSIGNSIIEENNTSGNFATLIDEVLLAKDSPMLKYWIERYTDNYYQSPKKYLKRIEPLAVRFPDNIGVQSRYGEILLQAKEQERALPIFKKVMNTENVPEDEQHFVQQARNRYQDILRDLGDHETLQASLLEALDTAKKNPDANTIQQAANARNEAGGLKAVYELMNRVLGTADMKEHDRIRADFATSIAEAGDIPGARGIMQDYAATIRTDDALLASMYFHSRWGFYEESCALYDTLVKRESPDIYVHHEVDDMVRMLLATGRAETAWSHLRHTRMDFPQQYYGQSSNLGRTLSHFSDYNCAMLPAQQLLEELRSAEGLSIEQRLFAAELEGEMGHMRRAMEFLIPVKDNQFIQMAFMQALQAIPPGLQGEFIPNSDAAVPLDPDQAFQAAQTATYGAMQLNNFEEAIKILDGLSPENMKPHHRLNRAYMYLRAKAYEKAALDCEIYMKADGQQGRQSDVKKTLAIAQAGLGNIDAAMVLWREDESEQNNNRRAAELIDVLVEQQAFDEASEIWGKVGDDEQYGVQMLIARARILVATGTPDVVVEAMETGYGTLSENYQDDFIHRYADFLQENDQWQSLLPSAESNPVLAGTLSRVALNLTDAGRKTDATLILDGLVNAPVSNPNSIRMLVGLLKDAGKSEQARELLLRTRDIAVNRAFEVEWVLERLMEFDAPTEAGETFWSQQERFPGLWNNIELIVRIAAGTSDTMTGNTVFDQLLDRADTGEKTYLTALRNFYRSSNGDGLDDLTSLVEEPNLSARSLLKIQEILVENGRNESALGALERLQNWVLFSSNTADEAAARAIPLYIEAGNADRAVDAFIAMLPARKDLVREAREALLENGEAIDFAATEERLIGAIKAEPANGRVSDLLAFRQDLAARVGLNTDALDLEGLKVSALEQYEGNLWTHRVDQWLVSPATICPTWETMGEALPDGLSAYMGSEAPDGSVLAAWRPANAGQIYPAVVLDAVLEMEDSQNQSAYGLTTVVSPDARTVKLAHGSDDWSRVWVNGTEVLTNPFGRSILIDQDIVEVALKEGINHVLVKCANRRGDWEFSLAVLENGAGLTWKIPDLPKVSEVVVVE